MKRWVSCVTSGDQRYAEPVNDHLPAGASARGAKTREAQREECKRGGPGYGGRDCRDRYREILCRARGGGEVREVERSNNPSLSCGNPITSIVVDEVFTVRNSLPYC